MKIIDDIEQIPLEIREAASKLSDLCKIHNMPRDMIYDGVSWDIHGLVAARVSSIVHSILFRLDK